MREGEGVCFLKGMRPQLKTQQHSLCPEQQHGHADAVLDLSGGGAEKQVGEEAMAVGAHRHQVAALLLHPLDDLLNRFAVRQLGLNRNTKGLKLCSNLYQICSVFGDFRADRVRAVSASCPTIGHMEQHQTAVRQFRELFDVLDDR